MRHKEIADLFWDTDVCVEQIIWLASEGHHQSDEFKDFCDDIENVRKLLIPDITEDDNIPEMVAEDLHDKGKLGFLVELSTPVPEEFSDDGNSWRGSSLWQLRWFYVDDLGELEDKIEPFADEVIKKERGRQANAKG